MSKIEELIKKYEDRLDILQGDVDEINDMYEEEFNPSDWSGGNFDDAYSIGEDHGEVFAEYSMIKRFISELEDLLNNTQ
ncbi:hypothetical protein [Lederbergia lenta]|uniref:hypothetical protein n=1 Tax=Lederbergia lenta TaxID=1467 RepID=UPI00203AC27D|nr:hypothetical protein [Lederbergia lenta]MCM3109890.1 hypothetical protein [Lederbergia lenta]